MHAVPPVLNYAGQVAVNGEAFDGNGLFKFALVNTDGTTTYWSNDGTSVDGSEPQVSVSVSVNGGLYAVLLGNTAQQGMGAIDPALFAQHTDAKLRVWFSDGVNGFQQLSPDRPFASVPYAFSAGTAQTAGSAPIANGAVNLDMLSQDVKTQINAPISRSRLSQEVVADINATIGMNRLSTEVTEKLNQEKTTTNYNAPSVGSLLAVPYGSDGPAGYSLYQRGEPNELVWEEKASVSVARGAYDSVVELNEKIYFAGGRNWTTNTNYDLIEMYDPSTNEWETLNSMPFARGGSSTAKMDGKLYTIGGIGLESVDIYDPSTTNWTNGVPLSTSVKNSTAVSVNGKIYLVAGLNSSNQYLDQVLCFDPISSNWTNKSSLQQSVQGTKLAWFENRIWAIGGQESLGHTWRNQSYDINTDTWTTEADLTQARGWAVAWVANGKIYVGGGSDNYDNYLSSIETYDPSTKKWSNAGSLPENKYAADSVVLNNTVYVIGGATAPGVYSNKVFAADLNASVKGVYDLYRKDGDAPVGIPVVQSEYADGSVTGSKMADGAITTDKLNEQILKYLKPEITSHPQAKIVYSYSNVSYSVTAEGKYLSYQWKKDGVDLAGETNATLNITDANATLHDGNYSVVVINDFGSVESDLTEVMVKDAILNGLVGWWKFDETSGTVAYDSSGNGNDGNLMNGSTWTSGKIGGAIYLNGSSPVEVSNYKGVTGTQARSVSFWMKSSDQGGDPFLWGGSISGSEQYYALTISSSGGAHNSDHGSLKLALRSGYKIGKTKVNSNQWFHVVVVSAQNSDVVNSKIYLNSIAEEPLKLLSRTINTGVDMDVKLGVNFLGLIDDVRIYDRALSAEEVQALYNLGQ